jgi:hypothetical protein
MLCRPSSTTHLVVFHRPRRVKDLICSRWNPYDLQQPGRRLVTGEALLENGPLYARRPHRRIVSLVITILACPYRELVREIGSRGRSDEFGR